MITLHTLTPRILAGVGIAALVAAFGLVSSRPAHTAGGPIPVTVANTVQNRDFDDPAHQPFQTVIYFGSTPTKTSATITVPTGKELVIENISAFAYVPTDHQAEVLVTTMVAGVQVTEDVGFADRPADGYLVMPVVPVRIYADPGSTVVARMERDTPIPSGDNYNNTVKLSGYFVNIP